MAVVPLLSQSHLKSPALPTSLRRGHPDLHRKCEKSPFQPELTLILPLNIADNFSEATANVGGVSDGVAPAEGSIRREITPSA